MSPRIVTVLVPTLLLLSPLAAKAQTPTPFSDVPQNHWAFSAVTALQQKGVLVGYPEKQRLSLGSRRPMIAVWCQDKGTWVTKNNKAPYLRIAIWDDGRVVFAADPTKWSHELREGKISAERIAELKKQIAATGVFGLDVTSGLVPDAPVDCLLIDLGKQQQILYWDEVESPTYGINSDPRYRTFKECWKALNQLALDNRPTDAVMAVGKFRKVPRRWYVTPSKPPKKKQK